MTTAVKPPKDTDIRVRLDQDTKHLIQSCADAADMSLAQWVRQAIREAVARNTARG